MRRRLALTLVAVVLISGASATAFGAPSSRVGAKPGPDSSRNTLYAEALASARAAETEGRLREAVWRWRVVEAVAPDRAAASRQAADAQARLSAAAEAAEAQGQAELKANRPGAARAAFERALELDPKREVARAYLRQAEAGVVLKDVAQKAGASPRTGRSRKPAARPAAKLKPKA